MWIKQIKKQNSPDGKVFYQYQLTRSARLEGKVRHISLLYLGSHPVLADKQNRRMLARMLDDRITGQGSLEEGPAELRELAEQYYQTYLIKHPEHPPQGKAGDATARYDLVNLASTRASGAREIGCEWMMLQMARRLGLPEFLSRQGLTGKQADLGLLALISRAIAVSSEHKTAQWLAHNSGLCELFDFPEDFAVTRHHLYQAASQLDARKEVLENHLYPTSLDLFGLDEGLMIYDLTNTYFEGVKAASELARFGRSKEKRNDCKQVVLAAVVTPHGMLRHSRIYEGNMSDPDTLQDLLGQLQAHSATAHTLILDAGIATEDNLAMLREQGFKYICVSRTRLKDYQPAGEKDAVTLTDKRGQNIECQMLSADGQPDRWMLVKSQAKAAKERSMSDQACQRFEAGLAQVKAGIGKKGGTKQYGKVMERIGRLKERYPRAHKHYQLAVEHDDKQIVTSVQWQKKPSGEPPTEGVYFLRTNYPATEEAELWAIYNTIRDVEATFRILKTDLNLRPIYHQKDRYTQAHLHLGLLAYQLVAAIRYQLGQHGLRYDWKNIVRIMNTQKLLTVHQQAKTKDIRLRVVSKPIAEAEQIYNALGFKHYPFKTKKYVVYH